MAHLLGSRFCIESLRNDVTDLQGAIIDVFSRVGPIRLPSWKYPDKISSDLDLTELLEIHDYSEDEEERQLAHIVLLELVIDRLVLLLQSMSKYTDQILQPSSRASQSAQQSSSTSIGLVVKKYWNKMIQLGSYLHQIQTENKNKTRAVADLESSLSKVMQEEMTSSSTKQQYVKLPLNEADASRLLSGTVSCASNYSISRDECIKATQTLETAFVPCESCDLVQRHFRHVGDMVVNICNTQDLPCSLAQHKSRVEKLDWMCGTDIARWATEQNKDLARINKHMSDLNAIQQSLQKDLEKEQVQNHQLMKRLSECAREVILEREMQSTQQKQFELKIKTLEKKCEDEVCQIQRKHDALQKCRNELHKQVEVMKDKIEEQKDIITELEKAKQQVLKDVEEKMINKQQLEDMKIELENAELELTKVKEQLETSNKELSREKAKNRSVSRHTQSLHGKQESLVQRLDELDMENQELRNQVLELEEKREELEEKMEKIKNEMIQMKEQVMEAKKTIAMLSHEKEKLEKITRQLEADIHQMKLQVQEAQEREHLLVQYPDINGPVNQDLTGTGDIVQDMENQIKANMLRIKVLEEENRKLRNSVTKLLSTKQSDKLPVPIQSVPLWKMEDSVVPPDVCSNANCDTVSHPEYSQSSCHDKNSSHLPLEEMSRSVKRSGSEKKKSSPGVRQSFVVGKGAKSTPSRPSSGKLMKESTNQTSINTYRQLKKAGLLKVGRNHHSSDGTIPPNDEDYQAQEVFSCSKCDKMYNTSHDLELHKLYCFGGI